MKFFLLNLSFLLLFSPYVVAKNYYLSNSGNDAAAGTQPSSAWKTIDKLNSIASTINPGDTIFFKRGDVFEGGIEINRVGLPGKPIVFTAYGNGAKPEITGSTAITNWTKMPNSNIWYANVSDSVAHLLVNHKFQTKARYPNQGYLSIDVGDKSKFTCANLKGGYNYWKDATVRVRTTRWTYESRRVTASTSTGQIWVDKNTHYPMAKNWGFFMDNKFEELDIPGEWFYDRNTNRVYFWPEGSQNPNNLSIRGIVRDYGFINPKGKKMENYVLRHLKFSEQTLEGVRFSNLVNKNILVEQCEFRNQGETGIHMTGTNVSVNNCFFRGMLGRGVKGHAIHGGTMRDNVMKYIGMREGYGYDGNANMNGFHITRSDNLYVGYNQIDSMGYTGVMAFIAYSTIEKNIISYCNLRLDDGAAIHCYDGKWSHHTLIQDNIISHIEGYTVGTKNPNKPTSHGIYQDWSCNNNILRNNTIIDVATSGIFINTGNYDMLIEDNVIIDCGDQGIRTMETMKANSTLNNTYRGNVVYNMKESAEPVYFISLYNTVPNMGVFEENQLINPYSHYTMKQGNYSLQKSYTQEQWENDFPHMTTNDKITPFQFTGYEVESDLTGDLVENGEFDADGLGWSFTAGSNVNSGWSSNVGLDGGAMEMELLAGNTGSGTIETNLGSNLKGDSYYQLSFSTISSSFGTLEVIFRTQAGALIHKLVLPYSPTRREHETVFRFPANLTNGKIGFRQKSKQGSHFIVDNISFKEVDAVAEDPYSKIEIFTNESNAVENVPLNGAFFDLDGNPVSGSLTVKPFSTKILFRGQHNPGNLPPKAICTADSTTGSAAHTVNFDASGSFDPDGLLVSYDWNFGDGGTATGETPAYTYMNPGTYSARLIVTDNHGAKDTAVETIVVSIPVSGDPCQTPTNWLIYEVGNHGVPSSVCQDINTGQFTISTSGEKIDSKWDSFVFTYQKMQGDGWMIARINNVQKTSNNAATGLMIRNSKWGDDVNAFIGIDAQRSWVSSVRNQKNGTTDRSLGGAGSAGFDYYVKIERLGQVVSKYLSEDGLSWTLINSQNLAMDSEVLIGLASLSGKAGSLAEMNLDQISMSNNIGINTFPVELVYFGADVVNESVELNWVTETELNNDYFTVERSLDGVFFETMANVEGAGTTAQQQRYSLTDDNPYKGSAYYRLKQTDLDGSFQYVGTIEVNFTIRNKAKLKAYPNPLSAGTDLNIAFEGIEPGQVQRMYLMDLTGREVSSIEPTNKYFTWELPSAVPSGTYVLVAIHQEGMLQQQIAVQ